MNIVIYIWAEHTLRAGHVAMQDEIERRIGGTIENAEDHPDFVKWEGHSGDLWATAKKIVARPINNAQDIYMYRTACSILEYIGYHRGTL